MGRKERISCLKIRNCKWRNTNCEGGSILEALVNTAPWWKLLGEEFWQGVRARSHANSAATGWKMTTYCTPMGNFAGGYRLSPFCSVRYSFGQKHRRQQPVASELAEMVHATTPVYTACVGGHWEATAVAIPHVTSWEVDLFREKLFKLSKYLTRCVTPSWMWSISAPWGCPVCLRTSFAPPPPCPRTHPNTHMYVPDNSVCPPVPTRPLGPRTNKSKQGGGMAEWGQQQQVPAHW